MRIVIIAQHGGALLKAIEGIPARNRHLLPGVTGIYDDRTLTLYTSDECVVDDRRKPCRTGN